MFSRHPDNMKTPSVSLLLGVCVLLPSALTVSAVSLQVSPNVQYFFVGSSVSLSCVDDDGQTADGWTVKRIRRGSSVDCRVDASGFWRNFDSFCVLEPSGSLGGVFFCESSSGERSDEVLLNVTETSVYSPILAIPALPVRAGSNVTLRCRHGFLHPWDFAAAEFYINGSRVVTEHRSELVITNVQKSDEGFYSCTFRLFKQFPLLPLGFLRVKDSAPTTAPSPPPPTDSSSPPPPPLIKLFCYLLAFCPYAISAALLLYICCSRKTANKPAVSMEMTQHGGGGDKLDKDDVTADVTTERYL